MMRICAILLAAFLIVIAAARFAYSISADTGDAPVDRPWSQNKMQFVAWNEEKWTAWIRDEAFELDPENTGTWSRHSNPSIAYVDWSGEPWQAKVEGDEFVLARHGNWSAAGERSAAIRYRDWNGNKQLRTVVDLRR